MRAFDPRSRLVRRSSHRRPAGSVPLTLRRLPAALLLGVCLAGCRQSRPTVSGIATYAGGPPVPANAVLEAALIERPVGPRPGRVIASILTGGPGPSPVHFRIAYDPTQIDPARDYAIRVLLLADRSVLYLTDGEPVLTNGRGAAATIPLTPARLTMQLPAMFTGTLACADCAGLRYHLELLPDSVFYLRVTRRESGDSSVRDDIGRWLLDGDGFRLTLRGSGVETFAPFGASVLRPMDAKGRPIVAAQGHALLRVEGVPPLEPALTFRGRLRPTDAGPAFADCRTGRPIPLAPGGQRAGLEQAASRAGAPADSALVRFEGRIIRTGAGSTILVTRALGASRAEGC